MDLRFFKADSETTLIVVKDITHGVNMLEAGITLILNILNGQMPQLTALLQVEHLYQQISGRIR